MNIRTGNPRGLSVFWFWRPVLFALLLPLPGLATADETLEEIRALADSGAATLAVHLLDERQPTIPSEQSEWLALERERVRIYRESGQWQRLASRLTGFPRNMPEQAVRWAMTERANAFLKLDEPRRALSVLRDLIWSGEGEGDAQWRRRWRELVMISYVRLGLAEDAYQASRQFYQDYPPQNRHDRVLRARILLMSGHPEAVPELLADEQDTEAGMLVLLAQLRSGSRPANKVMQAGLRHLRGKWVEAEDRHHLWAVIAEAARRSGDRLTAANALEHVLAAQTARPLPAGLFDYNADSLWNAYVDLATFLGNQQQFLIGDDAPWFKAADAAQARQPVRARAYYALLMFKGQSTASRERAAKAFTGMLRQRSRGAALVETLFLEGKQFKEPADIPLGARLELVDIALARQEIERASKLMASIQQVPEGEEAFIWQLRRARILVLGGELAQGQQTLHQVLEELKPGQAQQLDQVLQVVFDMQTAGAHEAALELFPALQTLTVDTKRKRELYYWMANSRESREQYPEAARLYLKSAMLIDPGAMDPWAQTARYQAGVALARGGLYADARALFNHLLRVTEDKSRRAALRQELQKIWLLEGGRSGDQSAAVTEDDAVTSPFQASAVSPPAK
ncbi:tetratricopeptide repeat protein [Thiohalophilus sp.]|uniref:tetratricopeptide repeat protein n=1 Tax=Thiohalophilus sp. TaxID=3028392 RepID=UPI003975892C